MKKIFYTIGIISAALLLSSCQKEEVSTPVKADVVTSLTFSLETPQTKTSFGDKTDSGKYPICWTPGDEISVLFEGINGNKPLTFVANSNKISEDGRTAIFDLKSGQMRDPLIVPEGTRCQAVFPASVYSDWGYDIEYGYNPEPAVNEEYGCFEFRYPRYQYAEMDYNTRNVTCTYSNTSYAQWKFGSENIVMNNIMGVLNLSFTGNAQISCIQINDYTDDLTIWGNYYGFDDSYLKKLGNVSFQDIYVYPMWGTIQLDPVNPTDFYIPVPAGAYKGGMGVFVYQPDLQNGGSELIAHYYTEVDNTIHTGIVHEMPTLSVND